ncbi:MULTISPECIES: hypothetical protein [Corynebacterium]|uniref:hypothetical protein n=1 Tax=Corynebacterium TaxID=1716 RepID=UPI0003B86A60|nr:MULTISPECIES: hypothetical protein [Corynebacterium]ERS52975.1 hypothetical protein HMPREF1267_00900 [Corynebacterium sp. KPL1824]MDK4268512.1 hypothetical protein [Corynebacterium accolens]MDK8653043.1 hypothetical protein [Corynebacterium accolens]WKS58518.1 hypothetical protein NLL35_02075 [Corynebacterium accolens]
MLAPTRTAPRRTAPKRMALGGLLVAGALCLSACGQGEQETESEPGIAKQETSRPAESAADTKDSPRDAAAQDEAAPADAQSDAAKAAEDGGSAVVGDLQRELDRIAANYGNVGIAVSDGTTTIAAGRTAPETAWSTSKVPVLIAAHRAGLIGPDVVTSAITYSNNAAAQSAWDALGGGAQAAQAAQQVLAEAGDTTTQVQSQVTRPEFSAFGQTQWSVGDQAAFMAKLRCVNGAEPILTAMSTPDPAQSYGLRNLEGAALKGGWGPDIAGGYDVRQMGLATIGGREVAVALIASAPDGQYASAQPLLSGMALDLSKAEIAWPTPAC